MLAGLGLAVFGLSVARFRRDLVPAGPRRHADASDTSAAEAARTEAGAR
jgi:hypothetical protein